MSAYHPVQLQRIAPLLDAITYLSTSTVRTARQFINTPPRARNFTLRAGPDTPLWNELARATRTLLVRRGDKAKLARCLGISRQRLHLLLVAKTRCPDAERTLLLLAWVSARIHDRTRR